MIKNSENINKKVMHSYMLRLNDMVQTKNKTLNFAFMFYYGQAMIALKRLPLALKILVIIKIDLDLTQCMF